MRIRPVNQTVVCRLVEEPQTGQIIRPEAYEEEPDLVQVLIKAQDAPEWVKVGAIYLSIPYAGQKWRAKDEGYLLRFLRPGDLVSEIGEPMGVDREG